MTSPSGYHPWPVLRWQRGARRRACPGGWARIRPRILLVSSLHCWNCSIRSGHCACAVFESRPPAWEGKNGPGHSPFCLITRVGPASPHKGACDLHPRSGHLWCGERLAAGGSAPRRQQASVCGWRAVAKSVTVVTREIRWGGLAKEASSAALPLQLRRSAADVNLGRSGPTRGPRLRIIFPQGRPARRAHQQRGLRCGGWAWP